jgi:predicted pyridoxine 5'-phosphate oxidase superfamily flavin-nucleotide-binding protein
VKIPKELVDFVSRPEVVKILATINSDGTPNVGPKMSTQIFDEGSLAYAEFVGKRHFNNVNHDKHIAIAAVDWAKREGYRFVGEAEVYQSGPVYDKIRQTVPGPPKAVVRLIVERIDILSSGKAGQQLQVD